MAIFWAVIGFRENFTVKALKADYDGKHQEARSKRRFRDVYKFLQIGIFKFVMGFIDILTVRA